MYLLVKTVHVFAVVLTIGGVLLLAMTLRTIHPRIDERSRHVVESVLRWDIVVTTPALAVVWLAGFTMAFGAGWDTSRWLLLKMIPVVFLTGLHTIGADMLRRALRGQVELPALVRHAPVATLVAFAAIAWLAVVKPF
jgi:uncharacterized membrane protein